MLKSPFRGKIKSDNRGKDKTPEPMRKISLHQMRPRREVGCQNHGDTSNLISKPAQNITNKHLGFEPSPSQTTKQYSPSVPHQKKLHLKSNVKYPLTMSNEKKYQSTPSYNSETSTFVTERNRVRINLRDMKTIRRISILHNLTTTTEDKEKTNQGCFNHQETKAKYIAQMQTQDHYCCTKCAVKLAAQGFSVNQLSQNPLCLCSTQHSRQNNHRTETLNNMMDRVQTHYEPHLSFISQNIERVKNRIKNYFKHEESKINQYYGTIIDTFVQYKEEANQQLSRFANEIFTQFQNVQNALQTNSEQLDFIKEDITPNLALIVDTQKVSETNFQTIVSAHKSRLQKCQQLLDYWPKWTINLGEFNRQKIQSGLESLFILRSDYEDKSIKVKSFLKTNTPRQREFSFEEHNDQEFSRSPISNVSPTFKVI